jgi:hypothetical protein
MTKNILYDILILFLFALITVGSACKWNYLKNTISKNRVFFGVLLSFLVALVLWLSWAIYGITALVDGINNHKVGSPPPPTTINQDVKSSGSTESKNKDPVDPPEKDSFLTSAGQAGDLFGGFTAFFSVLTFGGAVGALMYQQKAMRAAREQLSLQQFEPMFIFLLNQFQDMDKSLKLDIGSSSTKNSLSQAVKEWSSDFGNKIEDFNDYTVHDKARRSFKAMTVIFYGVFIYKSNALSLGPLFRALYHVFKAIKVSNLSADQKIRYANIARLRLNDDHLFLLAMNGLTDAGKSFKPLIEEYGLLKHLFRETDSGVRTARTGGQFIAFHLYRKSAILTAKEREEYWKEFPDERPKELIEE